MKKNALLAVVAVAALVVGALAGWGVTSAMEADKASQAAERYAALEAKYQELEEEHEALIEANADAEKALQELKELKEAGLIPTAQEAADMMAEASELTKSQAEVLEQLNESGALDQLLEDQPTQ